MATRSWPPMSRARNSCRRPSCTLTFEGGRLAVIAGCNTMMGGYTISDDVLVVDTLAQTQMACDPERHAQDEWVAVLFRGGPTLTRAVGTLTVASDEVTVTFDEQSDPPADSLDGSVWKIVSLDGPAGSLTAPDGAYIAYADGRVSISTGCNSGSAEVEVTDDTITFGPMALTRMACDGDVMEFETAVVEMLAGPWSTRSSPTTSRCRTASRRSPCSGSPDASPRVPLVQSGMDGIGPRHAVDLLDLHAEVVEVGDEGDHRRLVGDVQHDRAAAPVDRGLTDEL